MNESPFPENELWIMLGKDWQGGDWLRSRASLLLLPLLNPPAFHRCHRLKYPKPQSIWYSIPVAARLFAAETESWGYWAFHGSRRRLKNIQIPPKKPPPNPSASNLVRARLIKPVAVKWEIGAANAQWVSLSTNLNLNDRPWMELVDLVTPYTSRSR